MQMFGERQLPPTGGESLLRVVQRSDAFWVDRASSSKRLWFVVRDLASHGHQLAEGDVMKLGRFRFKVRQLVAPSPGGAATQQPDLRLDENGAGLAADAVPAYTEEQASEAVCRICLREGGDEDDPQISPCSCKGSIKCVHLGCLRYWIHGRLNLAENPGDSYFYRPLTCELCKSTYPTYITSPDGQDKQSLVQVPPMQPPFIVLENMVRDSHQHSTRGLHVISLADRVLKLGRGHGSDVRIADVSISRLHATIRFAGGQFVLEDNNSKFGTLIAMKKARMLEPGMPLSIQAGRTVLKLSTPSEQGHVWSEQMTVNEASLDDQAVRMATLKRSSSGDSNDSLDGAAP